MNSAVKLQPRTVVVNEGDTLATLAQRYYGDAALASFLAKTNGIAISAILTVGEKIRVPRRQSVQSVQRLPNPQGMAGVATDVPMGQPPVGPDGLTTITVTGQAPWWQDQKLWMGVAIGGALAWLLLGKNSPLKM